MSTPERSFICPIPPEEFESCLYRELHHLEAERVDVDAHKALMQYVPLVAAGGAMIITSMLLFKGLKQVALDLSALENWFDYFDVGCGCLDDGVHPRSDVASGFS
jgi:PiT family inorganic phosphate transporter